MKGASESPGSLEGSGNSFASGGVVWTTGSLVWGGGVITTEAAEAGEATGFVGLVTYMKQKTAAIVVLAIKRNG